MFSWGHKRCICALSFDFHSLFLHALVIEIGALLVPWNSMELLVSAKLAHSKFNGIPWNSMELLVSAKLAHSKFHGIPWNFSCQRNWRTPSSMEFNGIPWNFSCQRNWRTPSSMEFHGIPWNCSSHRNWRTHSSMEFHGTALGIKIGALLVPWNSTELLVSANYYNRNGSNVYACLVEGIRGVYVPCHSTSIVFSYMLLSSKLAHY